VSRGPVCVGGAALATFAVLSSGCGSGGQAPVLRPGTPFQGALDLERRAWQDFRIEVPPQTVLWRVRAHCGIGSRADLDLFAGRGDPPGGQDADQRAESSAQTQEPVETLVVDRLSEPPIASGPYWLRVECARSQPSATEHEKTSSVEFQLELELVASRTDAVLEAGRPTRFALDPGSGGFRSFRIDVPPSAQVLRVDLTQTAGDLDLYAHRARPMSSLEDCEYSVRHDYGCETLLIETGPGRAQPGPWFVDVFDALSVDNAGPFEILVGFEPEPPRSLLAIPALEPAVGAGPLAHALACVVELFTDYGGGSGTLVAPEGWILTNAHVVEGADEQPVDDVVVAITLDPTRPAVERFRGKVARYDPEHDLALLQIATGFYGQALPPAYRFPWLALGEPEVLSVGDPLWVVGYPVLGGTGSRVSIHCSHGIVCGFDRTPQGRVLKTDAQVLPGNSGGAALDAAGRLVGIPSSNLTDGAGLIGLVHPLGIFPPDWLEFLRARTKE
jgi:S1-C subfamily serine protease